MCTNNQQIGLSSESMGVENLPKNPIVTHVSAILFQKNLLINMESDSFLNKINRVNLMKDNYGNEVYGCIYKITNLINNKCYNGLTTEKNYKKYIRNHFKNALKGDQPQKYFYNAIRKYGKKNFKWEILGYCNSEEELNEAEIEAIWLFRSFGSDGKNYDTVYGYNMTIGGEGRKGYTPTIETRKKIGYASKNRTPETKEKIRQANLGKTYSDEVNAKKGLPGELNPFYGREHTEETKEKIRKVIKEKHNGLFGENNPFYGKEHTDETKEKIRNKLIGIPQSKETLKKRSNTVRKKYKEKLYNDYNINFIINLYFESYGVNKIAKIYNSLYYPNLDRGKVQTILNKFYPNLPKGHDSHPKTNQIKLNFIEENYNNKQDFYI